MNKKALFSDETEEYVKTDAAGKEGTVTVRFRTAADDAERVEYVIPGADPKRMLRVSSDEYFDYYETVIETEGSAVCYYFLITGGDEKVFFDKLGPSYNHDDDYNFCIIPGFETPEWAKGVIMYQIFTDRFCNGNTEDDTKTGEYTYLTGPVVHKDDWDTLPEPMDVGNFFGGDLNGIITRLDYLKSLNVGAIYLNPIFDSPSNHKYDCRDYRTVDKHIGDNETLIELINKAHEKGIRVILDGVFNHTSIEHKWVKEHPDYYVRNDDGELVFWWGMETLPKLNYKNENLQKEILDIAAMYLKEPYCADGWRLDVAADLGDGNKENHAFWKKFREVVKAAGEDKLIIAEHYFSPKDWLKGDEWDSVMNYTGFMDPLSLFLTGVDKHSDNIYPEMIGNGSRFMYEMIKGRSYMPLPSYMTAMNELDNHDHSRFLTRTNGRTGRLGPQTSEQATDGINLGIFRQAIVIQYTWQGMPTIYYGDEAGVCGWTDPDSRRAYPWGHEDRGIINFYRNLGRIHTESDALKQGSLIPMLAEKNMIAYARKRGNETVLVLVHNGDDRMPVDIPVSLAGIKKGSVLRRVVLTDTYGYDLSEVDSIVEGENMYIEMLPHSAFVFIHIHRIKNV